MSKKERNRSPVGKADDAGGLGSAPLEGEPCEAFFQQAKGLFFCVAAEPGERFVFTAVNPAFLDGLGLEEKLVIGREVREVFEAEAGDAMARKLAEGIRDGDEARWEGAVKTTAGERHFEIIVTRCCGGSRDGHFAGVAHEITTRKEAELALRKGEERFRAVFEQAAVGMALIETSTGRFLDVNRRACEIARLSREEMLATTYHAICHPEDDRVDDEHMERLKAGEIDHFVMEKRYLHPGGEVTWFNLTVSRAWGPGEAPLKHIAVVDDITERKLMEMALRESEARYARVAKSTNDGVWEWNIQTNTTYLSPRWKELLGFAEDELPNDRQAAFYDRLHPDDVAVVAAARQQNLERLMPYTVEVRLRMKSGEYRWFHIRGQAEGGENGAPARMAGTMSDITQRKLTEAALMDREAHLRAMFEQAAVGVGTIDIATDRFLEVNQRYCEIAGRTREEMRLTRFCDITHPMDLEANLERHEELRAGRITEFSIEKRYLRPDGSVVWVNVHASLLRDAGGLPERLLAFVEDITQRKQAEENYQRELRFNETLANHTSVMIVLLDRQGRMMHVNDATLKRLGYRREELLGRTPWEIGIMDAAETARAKERLVRLLKGEQNPPRETILRGKHGHPWHVELSSTTTRAPDGSADRIIVTGVDLSERNRLQNEILKVSEQEQTTIGHNLHDGIGQTLAGVGSLMEALEGELGGAHREEARRIRELVGEAIQEVRRMSHGLSPLAVKNRGLGGALQLLAETIRTNHRTSCVLEVDTKLRFEDMEKETHVYRIAQEAVNNALRHGRPREIRIGLRRAAEGFCELSVRDDGEGFKMGAGGQGKGIGTRVMEYRANCIEGTLEVSAAPRSGVTLKCRFPG